MPTRPPCRSIALLASLAALLACMPLLAQDAPTTPEPRSGDFDWLRMNNGEWLKGELKDLLDDDLVFESDEFDTQDLDWEDVAELHTAGVGTLTFRDRSITSGRVSVVGDTFTVTDADGERTYSRDEVRSLILGEPTEWNYWSGSIGLGMTGQSGNTNQWDLSASLGLQRRDAISRFNLDYLGAFGSVEGTRTSNNHNLTLNYDYYLTDRLYWRVARLQLFRDEFQNIELRATPSTGIGYDVIDENDLEWTVLAGVGWEYTRYYDPPPGGDSSDSTAAVILGSRLNWDITKKVEFGIDFDMSIPVPDTDRYNLRATLYTEIDIVGDLDFNVKLVWDRNNAPAPSADGTFPKRDDYRLVIGLNYDF